MLAIAARRNVLPREASSKKNQHHQEPDRLLYVPPAPRKGQFSGRQLGGEIMSHPQSARMPMCGCEGTRNSLGEGPFRREISTWCSGGYRTGHTVQNRGSLRIQERARPR